MSTPNMKRYLQFNLLFNDGMSVVWDTHLRIGAYVYLPDRYTDHLRPIPFNNWEQLVDGLNEHYPESFGAFPNIEKLLTELYDVHPSNTINLTELLPYIASLSVEP